MFGTVAMMSRMPRSSLAVLDFLMFRTIGWILMIRSFSLVMFLGHTFLLMLRIVLHKLEDGLLLGVVVLVAVSGYVTGSYGSRG